MCLIQWFICGHMVALTPKTSPICQQTYTHVHTVQCQKLAQVINEAEQQQHLNNHTITCHPEALHRRYKVVLCTETRAECCNHSSSLSVIQ